MLRALKKCKNTSTELSKLCSETAMAIAKNDIEEIRKCADKLKTQCADGSDIADEIYDALNSDLFAQNQP
jgi:hypothetical protein